MTGDRLGEHHESHTIREVFTCTMGYPYSASDLVSMVKCPPRQVDNLEVVVKDQRTLLDQQAGEKKTIRQLNSKVLRRLALWAPARIHYLPEQAAHARFQTLPRCTVDSYALPMVPAAAAAPRGYRLQRSGMADEFISTHPLCTGACLILEQAVFVSCMPCGRSRTWKGPSRRRGRRSVSMHPWFAAPPGPCSSSATR